MESVAFEALPAAAAVLSYSSGLTPLRVGAERLLPSVSIPTLAYRRN